MNQDPLITATQAAKQHGLDGHTVRVYARQSPTVIAMVMAGVLYEWPMRLAGGPWIAPQSVWDELIQAKDAGRKKRPGRPSSKKKEVTGDGAN